ncbi:MAG TPA: hypothetical protein VHK65_09225 [Candidatus Dormibacteraeota bacterium]|nr:hypothetical protein [Candidatus Dormibacteraeota bacterium]
MTIAIEGPANASTSRRPYHFFLPAVFCGRHQDGGGREEDQLDRPSMLELQPRDGCNGGDE